MLSNQKMIADYASKLLVEYKFEIFQDSILNFARTHYPQVKQQKCAGRGYEFG